MNPQALDALTFANERRASMRDLRQRVSDQPFREGCHLVAATLRDPDDHQAAIPVGRLLLSIARFGVQSVGPALRAAGIVSADRRVRDLTFRQRDALGLALEQRALAYRGHAEADTERAA